MMLHVENAILADGANCSVQAKITAIKFFWSVLLFTVSGMIFLRYRFFNKLVALLLLHNTLKHVPPA